MMKYTIYINQFSYRMSSLIVLIMMGLFVDPVLARVSDQSHQIFNVNHMDLGEAQFESGLLSHVNQSPKSYAISVLSLGNGTDQYSLVTRSSGRSDEGYEVVVHLGICETLNLPRNPFQNSTMKCGLEEASDAGGVLDEVKALDVSAHSLSHGIKTNPESSFGSTVSRRMGQRIIHLELIFNDDQHMYASKQMLFVMPDL